MRRIVDWAGREYTLDELETLVNQADSYEESFDDVVDGDMATASSIILDLVKLVREQEVHIGALPRVRW